MVRSLTILHEDDEMIVVAKPAGIATANVPAGEESVFTAVRSMIARRARGKTGAGPHGDEAGGEVFLGIVSRLDKPVSGVVVVAKNRASAAALAGQFRSRSVEKTYFAIVEGRFPSPLGQWVTWRDAIDRPGEEGDRRAGPGRMRASTAKPLARAAGLPHDGEEAAESGRPAELRARVLKRAGEVSLVEVRPVTGRRHQLRAQFSAHGCPILGDRAYGARLPFPEGIALHARTLLFDHPATGRPCRFVADVPESWRPRFGSLVASIPPAER